MQITILLLLSREQFMYDIFNSLEELDCDPRDISLLCIVNGEADLFVKARNICELSKFGQRLCVQVKPKRKIRQFDIGGRRNRIAELHNVARGYINSEYVFGIEDDTIVPQNALKKLSAQYTETTGMIEGVEMGRWGVPYIGAWKANDINEPTELVSLPMSEGTQEIDAGGFYCFFTRADLYTAHTFKAFDNNGLGPDVDFALVLRQQGLQNYADFSVQCIHKQPDHDIKFGVTIPRQVKMFKKGQQWRQNILP